VKSPPYQLRKNKAADRFALIESIRLLPLLGYDLKEFQYISMGGPYLEDMRQIYEFCPEIAMVSIEEFDWIWPRQEFHKPCNNIEIIHSDVGSYITNYSPDKKCIFWLDYTDLQNEHFDEFVRLLVKVLEGSIIKITLKAKPGDFWEFPRSGKPIQKKNWMIPKFRRMFERFLPHPDDYPSWREEDFSNLLKQMLHIAVLEAFPAGSDLTFIPLSSFYYTDSTPMFTLTGIVWSRDDIQRIIDIFRQDWEFADLSWDPAKKPRQIDIPDLSTKERLHLQECLPCRCGTRGVVLRERLGYLIEEDVTMTEAVLEQYAAFHRYFPYFLRGIP
jgi:hypothetical protein